MTVTFTTCPFEVTAGDTAGVVIEDRKTGQSWRLSNQQAREFGRLIHRHRRLAELAEYAPSSFGKPKPGAQTRDTNGGGTAGRPSGHRS